MDCSEIFVKKRKSSCDAEIDDINLTDNIILSVNCREKPLSPILSGSLNNRKFLIGRRLNRKKSTRVKLSDRFEEKERHLVVDPINVAIPISFDDNLSISQTNTLIGHLDKLEELDRSRKNIYKLLVNKTKEDNHFKKPKLITIETGKIKSNATKFTNINIKNDLNVQRDPLRPTFTGKLSVGFQTALGQAISVSDNSIKQYSKLFEDIIQPSQSTSEGRQNKYTFLKKLNSNEAKDFTSTLSNQNNISCVKANAFGVGFTTGSGSNIKVSEKAKLQAGNFFSGEEFADINFSSERILGFKNKINITEDCDRVASKRIKNNLGGQNIGLLTQAICESGISNTQIIHAVDNILCAIQESNNEFQGFSKGDVIDSCVKVQDMEKAIINMELINSVKCFNRNNDEKEKCQNIKKNPYADTFFMEDYSPKIRVQASKTDFLLEKTNSFRSGPLPACVDLMKGSPHISFQRASGKSIQVSKKSLNRAKEIFDKVSKNTPIENNSSDIVISINNIIPNKKDEKKQFSKKTECTRISYTKHVESDVHNSKNDPGIIQNLVTSYDFMNKSCRAIGFSKASGTAINISESSLKQAKAMFDKLDDPSQNDDLIGQPQGDNFGKKSCNSIPNLKIQFNKGECGIENYRSVHNTNVSHKHSITEQKSVTEEVSITDEPLVVTDLSKCENFNLSTKTKKKKLGVSHCKQIKVCDKKLDKAKLLFNEDLIGISPIKPKHNIPCTSTPIKERNSYSTPVRNNCKLPESFNDSVEIADITPIKVNTVENKKATIFNVHSKIICTSPTKDNWMNDLEIEKNKIEYRLQVILERQKLGHKALVWKKTGKSDNDKKPRKGTLFKAKIKEKKIPLHTFVGNKKPGYIGTTAGLPINPKNAENVHFIGQQYASVVTADEAQVVPNSEDMVGLSEIKNAFEAMPGVETNLIPKGWIRNHYKWIVWKLASYQNMFPYHFDGCLNIENIVQQLKYRYDREIDRAERSALRKIYEKDDAPQKRIVLCVSDIKMLDMKKYELELCDGWYAIRTIIDEPLCKQVINGKLKIGTKLVISGAELFNCDGCYPLETTNLVFLKINCNSTRRAVWYAKLGFQSNPNPFPIQLQSIYPLGGVVAAVKVSIVRVYPLKFMEKLEGRSVWRNNKAEEIRAQKWENENSKRIEQIQDDVRQKFEDSYTKKTIERSSKSNVSSPSIRCSKQFHSLMDDPECLQENLSISQKEAIVLYQNDLSVKRQEEMATEVNRSLSKLKLAERDVVPVLQLLVVDVNSNSNKAYNFSIWRPMEAHLQSIREGMSFTIQNVLPRLNGDLNSNKKTTFKMESSVNIHSKFKRQLVQIAELVELKSLTDFKEFDTVGIVIQVTIKSMKQEVWIGDNMGRLLLISIYEGPDTCLLLDNLKRSQTTTICNIVYSGFKKDIILATANHFTIFSSYPQRRHLQEGLKIFKKELTKDLQGLLSDCDNKIEVFTIISDIKNSFSADFEDTDEETLLP